MWYKVEVIVTSHWSQPSQFPEHVVEGGPYVMILRAESIQDLAAKASGAISGLEGSDVLLSSRQHDRSALDFAKKMAAAEARHEMNQKIGEHLGQDANEKSALQMLDDALAQARREQRERDAVLASTVLRWGKSEFRAGWPDEIAAAIRAPTAPAAPAAPARQRGEPARQRGEQED